MRARPSSRLYPAVAIGVTLAALAGCGDPAKLVPADDASAMDVALQRVADATIAGDCQAAGAALADAQNAFAGLPAGVSPALRSRIAEGLAQLTKTVPEQCTDAGATTQTTPTQTTETTTETTPTQTTTETTPPTQTTPTQTTPTQTTPTQTTPTQTTPDPGGISPDEGGAPAQQGGAG